MNFLRKYKYDIVILLVIILFVFLFRTTTDYFGVFGDRESFQEFIKGFGALAPLIIILIIVVEVVVAPIPGFIPIISAGFIFGPIEGSIYAFIGNVIGSILAFLIARKLGRPYVARIIKENRIGKYEAAIKRNENILLAFYFFPLFPIDIISFAFGLSNIKFKKFVIVISIGFIVHVWILNSFGDYLARLYF